MEKRTHKDTKLKKWKSVCVKLISQHLFKIIASGAKITAATSTTTTAIAAIHCLAKAAHVYFLYILVSSNRRLVKCKVRRKQLLYTL